MLSEIRQRPVPDISLQISGQTILFCSHDLKAMAYALAFDGHHGLFAFMFRLYEAGMTYFYSALYDVF